MIMREVFVLALLALAQLFLANNYGVVVMGSGVRCHENEKNALLDFKLSFNGDEDLEDSLSNWSIHNPECCEWDGIECDIDTGHVVSLDIMEYTLVSHQLRPSLSVLKHLTYLDLSYNTFEMKIPKFIGSFTKLTNLSLSYSGFFGKIPPHLGNLTSLQSLDIVDFSLFGDSDGLLYADSLQWLSHLSSLEVINLNGVNLSNAIDWLSTLKMLPSLSEFDLSSCSLPNITPLASSSCLLNHSTSLHTLRLSHNQISPMTFSCLINGSDNLYEVNLASVTSEQNIHEYLEALVSQKLESLDISHNLMNKLPDFSRFTFLKDIFASGNNLDGNIHVILQQLPMSLAKLDLSANSLTNVISDSHFLKFSKLSSLDLSYNYLLTFNFSRNWVPSFQLVSLRLGSCTLGPHFPNWILAQTHLKALDISNSSISGAIPTPFWNWFSGLKSLNASNNNFQGTLPNLALGFKRHSLTVDLSFNDFHGPIPLFLFSKTDFLDLSNNKFSSFYYNEVSNDEVVLINLSNNRLSGSLPNYIFRFESLVILNLAYNMLNGTISGNIASLFQLNALHLNNNRFSGELPSSMKNCSHLTILELASNNFSGSVPIWLGGHLQRLIVLNLRSNYFSGDFPSNLCNLQGLQVLDLSSNKISGSIPSCVNNFTSMTMKQGFIVFYQNEHPSYSMSISRGYLEVLDSASIMWKGRLANESSRKLPQWNIIDLSDNYLTGEIPIGVTSLKYLRSLDLSGNNLNGSIPLNIGQLKNLEALHLSSNALCGDIPQSLAGLTFLNSLNLSNNNLSGRIPTSTQLQSFDPSSYGGNPELCGVPLPTKCPSDKDVIKPPTSVRDHNEDFDFEALYAALGIGFAFGLFGVFGILNFHAPSRHVFFHMASEVGDWIIVNTILCHARIKRRLYFKEEKQAPGI